MRYSVYIEDEKVTDNAKFTTPYEVSNHIYESNIDWMESHELWQSYYYGWCGVMNHSAMESEAFARSEMKKAIFYMFTYMSEEGIIDGLRIEYHTEDGDDMPMIVKIWDWGADADEIVMEAKVIAPDLDAVKSVADNNYNYIIRDRDTLKIAMRITDMDGKVRATYISPEGGWW